MKKSEVEQRSERAEHTRRPPTSKEECPSQGRFGICTLARLRATGRLNDPPEPPLDPRAQHGQHGAHSPGVLAVRAAATRAKATAVMTVVAAQKA